MSKKITIKVRKEDISQFRDEVAKGNIGLIHNNKIWYAEPNDDFPSCTAGCELADCSDRYLCDFCLDLLEHRPDGVRDIWLKQHRFPKDNKIIDLDYFCLEYEH